MKYIDYLKIQTDCVLCNYPEEYIVHNGKYFAIILARSPYVQDHTMLITKRHIKNFHELEKEEYDELGFLIEGMNKLFYHVGYQDLSLFVRDGLAGGTSGKSITHFHYHIIPGADVRGIHIDLSTRHFMSDEEFLEKSQDMKVQWKELYGENVV